MKLCGFRLNLLLIAIIVSTQNKLTCSTMKFFSLELADKKAILALKAVNYIIFVIMEVKRKVVKSSYT